MSDIVKAALDAAVQRVDALPKEDGGYCHVVHYCDVITAIKNWYTHTSDDCPMRGQSDYVGCAVCDKGES